MENKNKYVVIDWDGHTRQDLPFDKKTFMMITSFFLGVYCLNSDGSNYHMD